MAVACALLVASLGAAGATTVSAASVTDLRTGLHPTHTRLVLELSDEVAYSIHLLDEPRRLVVDLPEFDVRLPPGSFTKHAIGVIEALHSGASASGAARLVVDLARPAMVKQAYLMPPDGGEPHLLVLDLEEIDAGSYARMVRASEVSEIAGSRDPTAAEPAAGQDDAHAAADGNAAGSDGAVAVVTELAGVDRDALILELLMRIESLERQLAARGLVQVPAAAGGEAAPTTPVRGDPAEQQATRGDQDRSGGAMTVDDTAVERALERSLTQAGVLLLMPGQVEVEPAFRYLRRDQAGPVFVSDLAGTELAVTRSRANEFDLAVDARLGMPWDSQFELGVPFAYREWSTVVQTASTSGLFGTSEQTETATGFGDIRIGLAKTIVRERSWWPDLVTRLEWDTDSGSTRDGIPLGTGFNEVTGEIVAVKRQDPLAFVGRVGHRSIFESDRVDPGDELFFSLGVQLALSPETSLNASFDQIFAREVSVGGQEIPGSDLVNSVFTIGTSSIINSGTLLSLTGGIGLTEDAPDYFVQLAIPVRFDLPLP